MVSFKDLTRTESKIGMVNHVCLQKNSDRMSSIFFEFDIYIYIFGTPPPRPILSQNLLVFALFCCFLLCLNVCFFWRLFYIFKKLCRVVKTLPPLIKLFSFNRKGFLQNLEKTKKPKNQNFLEKFWFQVKRLFFFVFLEFFWFFLV